MNAAVIVRAKSEKKEFVKSIKSRLTVSQVMRISVFYYSRSFCYTLVFFVVLLYLSRMKILEEWIDDWHQRAGIKDAVSFP